MTDRLRELWDFDDLPGTQSRLLEALRAEPAPARRAELVTQLARIDGLSGRFEEGEQRLREAEQLGDDDQLVAIRVRLERGRLLRTGGDAPASLPHFEAAHQLALAARHDCLAADAAHMAALAAGNRSGFLEWTERGLGLALRESPGCPYWAGPLLNNLGWEYFDAGEPELALETFQQALAVRQEQRAGDRVMLLAREAVATALRSLGRRTEAEELVDQV